MDVLNFAVLVMAVGSIGIGILVWELYRQFGVMYLLPPEPSSRALVLQRGGRLGAGSVRVFRDLGGRLAPASWPRPDATPDGQVLLIGPLAVLTDQQDELVLALAEVHRRSPSMAVDVAVVCAAGEQDQANRLARLLCGSTSGFRALVDLDGVLARSVRSGVDAVAYATDARGWIATGGLLLEGHELLDVVGPVLGPTGVRSVTRLGPGIPDELEDRLAGDDLLTGPALAEVVEQYLRAVEGRVLDDVAPLLDVDVVFRMGDGAAVVGKDDLLAHFAHEIFPAGPSGLVVERLSTHGAQCWAHCRLGPGAQGELLMRFVARAPGEVTYISI